jgi:zinc transport system ATP-binding protein
VARRALRESIDRVADIVGIRHLLDRRIGELSGGEEQRTFIAQALVSDPELLVLDEPTAGVDLSTEESFYSILHELNSHHGKTILLVSHDLEALAHNAKTALCLNKKIVYFGAAEGLHERSVVEAAFGSRAWHPSEDTSV